MAADQVALAADFTDSLLLDPLPDVGQAGMVTAPASHPAEAGEDMALRHLCVDLVGLATELMAAPVCHCRQRPAVLRQHHHPPVPCQSEVGLCQAQATWVALTPDSSVARADSSADSLADSA